MDLTGKTLGQYRVVDHLGRGGMADVYKAYHDGLAVYRAIKVVRKELVTEGDFKARFSTEAKAVAQLRHPNIVQVQDFCADGGQYYMVMEYVEGKNLKECVLKDGPIRPIERAAAMIGQLASALHYAHNQGIVHRDIKPQNVILDANGDPVLTDFGIAKLTASNTQLTQTGMSIGTPAYMAPEQALGDRNVGPAADIYSLTVVLYEALTGKVPFDADTPLATMLKMMNDPLPLPKEVCGEISDSLQRVILKGMARKPEDRYATALEFKSALEAAVKVGDAMETTVFLGKPVVDSAATAQLVANEKRTSSFRPGVAALALVMLAGGAFWMYQSKPELMGFIDGGKRIANKDIVDEEKTEVKAAYVDEKKQAAAAKPVDHKEAVEIAAGKYDRNKVETIEVETINASTLVVGARTVDAGTLAANMSPTSTSKTKQTRSMAEITDGSPAKDASAALAMLTPTAKKKADASDAGKEDKTSLPPMLVTGVLNLNESTKGVIERSGQTFLYTFEEYAGENIYLDEKHNGSGELSYRLTAPDGRTNIFANSKDSGPWQLPQSGTYTLEIVPRTNKKIDFEFVLWRLFPAVIDDGELTLNRYTKNATKFPGQKVIYEFAANEGQRVYFDEQHLGNQLTNYRLIAPDGRTKVFETNKDTGPLTLPQSGTYLLEIDPTEDNTVEFAFVLRKQ
ncbi:MAG: serine/threonine protein kinase [Pseudomonadales bacterium]